MSEMPSNLPVFDELDREIIKHKQVHFASSFPAMIAYYEKESKGAVLPVEIERLQELHGIEQATGHDLATLVLSDQDIVEIKQAKEAYHKIEALEKDQEDLVDLIFSEEEDPKELIEKLSQNATIRPLLLEMLQSDDFFNPLFPGYGFAPVLAAKVLAKAKEKKAIPLIFERIGQLTFDIENDLFATLANFEQEGIDFLLQILRHKGLSSEVKHAILALAYFEPNEELSIEALRKLQSLPLVNADVHSIVLIELCRALKDQKQRVEFSQLKQTAHPELASEIERIEKDF